MRSDNQHRRRARLRAIVLAAAVLAGCSQPTDPGRVLAMAVASRNSAPYKILDLGTLGYPGPFGDAPRSTALAVNQRGQVVGWAQLPAGTHAFLWQDGSMRDLGALPRAFPEYAAATDINDQGQVVGRSVTAAGSDHAFLWEDGVMQDLGTLSGGYSSAQRINERGQILGYSDGSSVLWDNGAITALGIAAQAMNDRGQVVGDLNTGSTIHAAIWEAGVVTDLGTLDGGDSSWARDISNSGWVVGGSRTATGEVHAVRWGQGELTDLGTLPGDSRALGLHVNPRGQVAGQSSGTSGRHAFQWHDGVMQQIGGLTVSSMNAPGVVTVVLAFGGAAAWWCGALTELPPMGDHHVEAVDISNAGWIVGLGVPLGAAGGNHAALWLPGGEAARVAHGR